MRYLLLLAMSIVSNSSFASSEFFPWNHQCKISIPNKGVQEVTVSFNAEKFKITKGSVVVAEIAKYMRLNGGGYNGYIFNNSTSSLVTEAKVTRQTTLENYARVSNGPWSIEVVVADKTQSLNCVSLAQ